MSFTWQSYFGVLMAIFCMIINKLYYLQSAAQHSCKYKLDRIISVLNLLLHAFKLSVIKSFCDFFWFLSYPLSAWAPFFTRQTNGQDLAVQTKYNFLGNLDRKLEWQIYIYFCTDLYAQDLKCIIFFKKITHEKN